MVIIASGIAVLTVVTTKLLMMAAILQQIGWKRHAALIYSILLSLHTVAEPAVRAAVKNLLSYGNDTIIVFSFEAKKNKDNAIISLASSNN